MNVRPMVWNLFNGCVILVAWGQSRFIREYANYLEEKTNTFKALGRSIELLPAKDGGEWIKTLKFAKLKETVPKLQSQFGKLLKCDVYLLPFINIQL